MPVEDHPGHRTAPKSHRSQAAQAEAAFEDIASAIDTQNPSLNRAECRRTAQFSLEGTARQIRDGKSTVASQPHKPSRAFDIDEFVRSFTEGTDAPGHSDDSL